MATQLVSARTPRSRGVFISQKELFPSKELDNSLKRIAHEITERNPGDLKSLVLVGIQERGVPIAERISTYLSDISERPLPVSTLDPAFHRDDVSIRGERQPRETKVDDLEGKTVVIVDDVLFTGRTIRAALDAILEGQWGRPGKVQLAVAVDRGHRELPIRADFVGRNIPTSEKEHIDVTLATGVRLGTLSDEQGAK